MSRDFLFIDLSVDYTLFEEDAKKILQRIRPDWDDSKIKFKVRKQFLLILFYI